MFFAAAAVWEYLKRNLIFVVGVLEIFENKLLEEFNTDISGQPKKKPEMTFCAWENNFTGMSFDKSVFATSLSLSSK